MYVFVEVAFIGVDNKMHKESIMVLASCCRIQCMINCHSLLHELFYLLHLLE